MAANRRRVLRHAMGIAAAAAIPTACAQPVPEFSEQARRRLFSGPDADRADAETAPLLVEGEALLAAGDARGALQRFEQAAQRVHAAPVELSLVRSQMQMGDYRGALAFCAHAAGTHRNFAAGSALYAWMLHVGGFGSMATTQLQRALADAPTDEALLEAREQLSRPFPLARGALLRAPIRAAPYAATLPAGARVAATAALGAGGETAFAPLAATATARSIWLRNGLGEQRAARLRQALPELGLAWLDLESPLPVPSGWTVARREPFAGSPGFVVEFAPKAHAEPAWPLLRPGFFGRAAGGDALPVLGISTPVGPGGGPVFDRLGEWAAIAVADGEAPARRVPFDRLPARGLPPSPHLMKTTLEPFDLVYERGLRAALQLVVQL